MIGSPLKTRIAKSLLTQIETCTDLKQLNQIHAKTILSLLSYTQFVLTKLVSSFLSLQSLDYATRLFNEIQEPNIFLYNGLIKAYSNSRTPAIALSLYNKMRVRENALGDKYTFPFVIKACASVPAVEKGREIHGVVVRIGHDFDKFLCSSLLNFYSVCNDIESARRVFDEFSVKDVVFWNAMILGYARMGMALDSIEVFEEMLEVGDAKPNEGTMVALTSACIALKNLKLGKEVHGYVIKEVGFSIGVKLGAALIDLYVKCGLLDYAKRVFDEMPVRNDVVWNSLISGYCQNGSLREAVNLFRQMHLSRVKPDGFTISSLLSACAQMGAINVGNWVRKFAEKEGIWDVFTGTSLIDMYAKCGSIGLAREVFDQMDEKTITTWNAIIYGYASNGQAESALKLFDEMRNYGARPNSVTFLAILHACVHAGLVEKGKQFFDMMMNYYGMSPKVEHYGCMVDLLGRGGHLKEAREFIDKMVIEPNVIVWGALLSACSIHGDVEIGEWAAHHILKLDVVDAGSYVLLANLFAAAHRFDGVKAIREGMMKLGINKLPGCSMIEVGDVVHEFLVADKTHPRSEEIYLVLDELNRKLKMAGYVPLLGLDEECLEICLSANI